MKPHPLSLSALFILLPMSPLAAQVAALPPAAPEVVVAPPPTANEVAPPPVTEREPEPPAAEPVAPAAQPGEVSNDRTEPTKQSRVTEPARPVPEEAAPAQSAEAPAAAGEPAGEPLNVETPLPVTVPAPSSETRTGPWLWMIAFALIAGLIGLAWRRSRRRRRIADSWRSDHYREDHVTADYLAAAPPTDEPFVVPPAPAEPVPAAEEDEPVEAARTPVEDDAGEPPLQAAGLPAEEAQEASPPSAHGQSIDRPLLEMMMRPLRAGITDEEAMVEFELTINNAGGIPAEDVRISSWMFAAGSVQASSMERMLLDPPAQTTLSQVTIPPGSGARIKTSIGMPRSVVQGSLFPVVVADARYILPGGGLSRISASFEIGRLVDGDLEPFSVDGPSGLEEGIGWRLYGEVYSD